MTVYADEAFLLNAAVDYLLLICGAKLGGGRLLRLRFALAAALGGLYAAAALSPRLAFLQALPMKLASLAAMLLLAYGIGRHTLRVGLLFLAAVCAFGGMALAAAQIFGTGVLVLPGGAYYAVSSAQRFVMAGSAISMRLRMIIRGLLPQMASMSGLRLVMGMRASRISHTASTSFTSASIIRRVLVMWPGYHWIFMLASVFFVSCFMILLRICSMRARR